MSSIEPRNIGAGRASESRLSSVLMKKRFGSPLFLSYLVFSLFWLYTAVAVSVTATNKEAPTRFQKSIPTTAVNAGRQIALQSAPNPWVQAFTPLREFFVSSNGVNALLVRDYSGQMNHGTPPSLMTHGEGWVQSPTGQSRALLLNGIDDRVTLAAGVCPWGSNATIEAWIRTTTVASSVDLNFPILAEWNDLSRGGTGQAFGIESGRITFSASEYNVDGCPDLSVRIHGGTVNDGNWHQVVAVIDHVQLLVRLYVDGQLSAEGGLDILAPAGCGIGPMRTIGGTGGWPFLFLEGALDELRVYNRILSASEILAHYNGGVGQYGMIEPGLVAGWHFDDANSEQTPMNMESGMHGAKPGDLFLLLNGTYTGGFTNSRSGTLQNPIVFRNRVGHRAIINGGFELNVNHVWIWGLEILDPDNVMKGAAGIGMYGAGIHAINNIIHHQYDGSGIGAWNTGAGQVIYGNIVYENGQGPQNPHGLYTQNSFAQYGYKYIVNNMFVDAANVGPNRFNVHAYGECSDCGPILTGFWFEKNLVRNGPFLLGGFNEPVTDCVIKENYFYMSELQLGYRRPTQVEVLDNYLGRDGINTEHFWGAGETIYLERKPNVYTGNTILFPPGPHVRLQTSANLADGRCEGCTGLESTDIFNGNHYSPPFRATFSAINTNFGLLGFSNWTNTTAAAGKAFDVNSTVDGTFAGVKMVLLSNEYEPGRAHLIIYNWDLVPSVTVDLSPIVNVGDFYRIHNANDAFGAPRRSGTYTGPVTFSVEGEEFLALLVTSTPRGQDTDGDRIPDFWEMSFGFDPIKFSDAQGDIDLDGMTEYDEYVAGTDPYFATSRLDLRGTSHTPAGFTLSFPTVFGQNYVVEYADTLPMPDWAELARGVGDGAQQSVTDQSLAGVSKRFYRIHSTSALTIQSMQHQKTTFSLRFPTVEDRTYIVQYADDPASANWAELTRVIGDGTERTITDTTMGSAVKRFYRVEVLKP